jgi:hypothetical protein
MLHVTELSQQNSLMRAFAVSLFLMETRKNEHDIITEISFRQSVSPLPPLQAPPSNQTTTKKKIGVRNR